MGPHPSGLPRFGAAPLLGLGLHPSNLHPSGTPHFGDPTFRAPHLSGHQPSGTLRGTPPPDSPKFRLFFPLPLPFSLFFCLSGGLIVEFWWCLKRRDTQMFTFGISGCRVICPPLRPPKKSMTNCKFCLYPEKKESNTAERNSTGRRPLHLRLLFLLLVFLLRLAAAAVFAAACACCCFWAADRRTHTFAVFDLQKCREQF